MHRRHCVCFLLPLTEIAESCCGTTIRLRPGAGNAAARRLWERRFSQSLPRFRPVGDATVTIRGSGFVNGVGLTINGKTATVIFKDVNTLSATVPVLTPGPQRITITNPDGESVSLDAAVTAS